MHDSEYLRYIQTLDDETLVVSMIGEVCYESHAVLDQAAADIAVHGGPVRLDLARVPFMDSTGVNFLVRQHHYVTGHGHRFVVAGARPHPARVLAVCGLTGLFDIGDPDTTGDGGELVESEGDLPVDQSGTRASSAVRSDCSYGRRAKVSTPSEV
ncbi:MAG: STAS domain-containing protein [Streptomycetaceae bacterium]|nr:STAS domain-containing protein [Streptomycetaceae bacterium]